MSRSYKRYPGWKDSGRDKSHYKRFAKRRASKQVRRYQKDIDDGKWYRKLSCSWDICDWNYRFYSREEVIGWTKELKKMGSFWNSDPWKYWMK